MASTFQEMYSDYIDQIKTYTQKLDVTEISFMRNFTRGIQQFQRKTDYIQKRLTVQPEVDRDVFVMPDDFRYAIEIKDVNSYTLIAQDFEQFSRTEEISVNGYNDTQMLFSERLTEGTSQDRFLGVNSGRETNARMYTMFNGIRSQEMALERFNRDLDTEITIYYLPDIATFSYQAPEWAVWQGDTNFNTQFNTGTVGSNIHNLLAPFEDLFLTYAVMSYLKSRGHVNYKVFEQEFNAGVREAIINRPDYFENGQARYQMGAYT